MADKKISQLGAVTTPLVGTEEVPVVQSGTTKKATVKDFLVVGDATATIGGVLNGVASGTNQGVYFLLQNGGTSTVGIGNKSSVVGGAYSAIPIVYFNGQLDFYDNATLRGRWDSSGNLAVSNGNLIQGTAAKGINFTANTGAAGMTSQLLNWYEEGTWTPGFSFGGGTTGITYSTQSGYYTRVGNIVHVTCLCELSNKGSSTGNALLTGLPFTIANNVAAYTAGSQRFQGMTYTGMVETIGLINTTTVAIEQVDEAGNRAGLTDTNFNNTTGFVLQLTYRAA